MRHKKLKLSTLLLLGFGLTGLQAQTMYVKEKSGSQTAYTLSDVRKMTFSLGTVTVQKTDNSMREYALNTLKYLNFTSTPTAIDDLKIATDKILNIYPNPVVDLLNVDFTGLEGEKTISVLTLEGKVMQSYKTKDTSIITLDLGQLPQGIYLCRFTNKTEIKTVKIIKQ